MCILFMFAIDRREEVVQIRWEFARVKLMHKNRGIKFYNVRKF